MASTKISNQEIHFAPLQGYTDMAYYSAYSLCFESIDYYYTPYFSVDDRLTRNIDNLPERIADRLVVQILPKDLEETRVLVAFAVRNNFKRINLNLGCPYPMVTRRGRGAALIAKGDLVANMIDYILNYSELIVSVKTRLGQSESNEVLGLLNSIGTKNIESVIVHPRTASQLYKGKASSNAFLQCRKEFSGVGFIYNGDIVSVDDFYRLNALFGDQQRWMIGRGLLSNPFLSRDIKGVESGDVQKRKETLRFFVTELVKEIESSSNDSGHAFNRVKVQLGYLSNAFPDPQKLSRVIRRSKKISEIMMFIDYELGVI